MSDERGNLLMIVGRLEDIVIRGGQNIHPAKVEELALKHPKIARACRSASAPAATSCRFT